MGDQYGMIEVEGNVEDAEDLEGIGPEHRGKYLTLWARKLELWSRWNIQGFTCGGRKNTRHQRRRRGTRLVLTWGALFS